VRIIITFLIFCLLFANLDATAHWKLCVPLYYVNLLPLMLYIIHCVCMAGCPADSFHLNTDGRNADDEDYARRHH